MILTLQNGQLHNQMGDTGYIAANYQFQFDSPPQTGAIYTAGFSLCGNGSLAIGGSAVFYSCNSGGFNNLYDRSWAPQCSPIYINTIDSGSSSGSASPSAGVSQTVDAQPQAMTSAGVSQINDNVSSCKTLEGPLGINYYIATTSNDNCRCISDQRYGKLLQVLAKAFRKLIGTQQPQAPTSAVSQISDNQPQAPTSAPAVTQISDNVCQGNRFTYGIY